MGEVSFELPWPPSVNRYYRHVGPRVLISRAGRQYRTMCVSRLAGRFPRSSGQLRLSVEFYPPDNRRRDLDNLLKCLQDSLQCAGLYEDDSQIKELHLEMCPPWPPEGKVHVRIASLSA